MSPQKWKSLPSTEWGKNLATPASWAPPLAAVAPPAGLRGQRALRTVGQRSNPVSAALKVHVLRMSSPSLAAVHPPPGLCPGASGRHGAACLRGGLPAPSTFGNETREASRSRPRGWELRQLEGSPCGGGEHRDNINLGVKVHVYLERERKSALSAGALALRSLSPEVASDNFLDVFAESDLGLFPPRELDDFQDLPGLSSTFLREPKQVRDPTPAASLA